jgi:predicted transcriptional regulator
MSLLVMNLPIVPIKLKFTQSKSQYRYDWYKTIHPSTNESIESVLDKTSDESEKKLVVQYFESGLDAEQFLLLFYKSKTVNEIAVKLDCHRNVVLRKAKKLSLRKRRNENVPGGAYRDDLLIQYYNDAMCNTCIALKLNRTTSAIAKKIQRLSKNGEIKKSKRRSSCNSIKPSCTNANTQNQGTKNQKGEANV